MFERYTEKARRVIFFARYEASQFGSPYIETEHLLLGLLREDKALANRFLRSHAAVESIRKQIEGHTTIREKVSTSVDLPLSHECKLVLAYGIGKPQATVDPDRLDIDEWRNFKEGAGMMGDLPDLLQKPVTAVATHIHADHIGGHHEFEDCIVHRTEAAGLRDPTEHYTLIGEDFDPTDLSSFPLPGYALTAGPMITAIPCWWQASTNCFTAVAVP